MAKKTIWTPEAEKTFGSVIDYLESNLSAPENDHELIYERIYTNNPLKYPYVTDTLESTSPDSKLDKDISGTIID